ncbi:hypothetical protein B0T17DRAFT_489865 [Bombardia bombarda]|uniref:Integral membrane protein TmpA n=1 Tax=Bombardia bombarda TaxID=252184 RepID=A0AA39XAD4_9PEZI|nr:hypothetical protein B0T17DRAFT_489865 [Bombardia bombarda]
MASISPQPAGSSPSPVVDEKQTAYMEVAKVQASSDIESQIPAEFEAEYEERKRLGFVRYTALNVYRRLFSFIFICNAIAFIIIMYKGPSSMALVSASSVNLMVCGLCRNPTCVNMVYRIFTSVPKSAPIRIRRIACKVFHIGGFHSGSGIAAVVWYIGFSGVYTAQWTASPVNIVILVLVWTVLAFLLSIVFVAYPIFRAKRHDYFELTHRFSNWIILVLFWGVILVMSSQAANMGIFLVNAPAFWVLIVITVATVWPWMQLRKVEVVPEHLSDHAVRLHFKHTPIKFGKGLMIASHPLKDWHAFATFTDKFDTPGSEFSCLVSKAGDWTKKTINEKPTQLWKKGVPTYGFGYVMRVFHRIICVTTGSGIGPCLSFIESDQAPKMRVIWQTRNALKTYGERTLELVKRMDENPVILDTSVLGRVDMVPIILRLFKEFDAEAVCVISNAKVTKDVVYALELRGVPAYGPLFDS